MGKKTPPEKERSQKQEPPFPPEMEALLDAERAAPAPPAETVKRIQAKLLETWAQIETATAGRRAARRRGRLRMIQSSRQPPFPTNKAKPV